MDIPKIINEAFNTMKVEYEKIFKYMYPAYNSNGFIETNQTVNFVNSLKMKLEDSEAIAWFEFPWKYEINSSKVFGRIDALVYSPKNRTLFCIESKRIKDDAQKRSIKKDIERLKDGVKNKNKNNESLFIEQNSPIIEVYLIALGDVWLETCNKKDVPRWWLGKKGASKIPEKCRFKGDSTDYLVEVSDDWICDLHELKTPRSGTTYCLMSAYTKIIQQKHY